MLPPRRLPKLHKSRLQQVTDRHENQFGPIRRSVQQKQVSKADVDRCEELSKAYRKTIQELTQKAGWGEDEILQLAKPALSEANMPVPNVR